MSEVDEQQAWHDHNLSQLRYFRSLSLRAKMQAVEGMADVVRRFRQLRAQGKIRRASPPAVHETPNKYVQNDEQESK